MRTPNTCLSWSMFANLSFMCDSVNSDGCSGEAKQRIYSILHSVQYDL